MLKTILENLPKYEKEFFGEELDERNREAYKVTLQSELRITYFHSIETFFELFFALDPRKHLPFHEEGFLFALTNSGFSTYKEIENLATKKQSLQFLDDRIKFQGHEISIGYYLFYYCFINESFNRGMVQRIQRSIEAIKYGIYLLANDFTKEKREEYNSYKHGLRVISVLEKFTISDLETKKNFTTSDLSNSMSFYQKTDNPNEIRFVTKLFDVRRDINMGLLCSNLISNMIYYRTNSKDAEFKMPFIGYSKSLINKLNNTKIKQWDLFWILKRK